MNIMDLDKKEQKLNAGYVSMIWSSPYLLIFKELRSSVLDWRPTYIYMYTTRSLVGKKNIN
jgi:hypothetical protein